MSLRGLKWFTILMPPFIIGSFEYLRHSEWMLQHLSMEHGNFFITLLSLLVSYVVSTFLFRRIERANRHLAEEQTKRAVLEERERLARELHDRIAQMLFYLNVSLKDGKVGEARSVVAEIDGHLRQAIYNLRRPPGEDRSFAAHINGWLEEWRLLTGIRVEAETDFPADYFTEKERIALLGIIQEAFTNIRKHAGASEVAFRLVADGQGWEMRVRDNGQGSGTGFANGEQGGGSAGAVTANGDAWGKGKYGISIMKKRALELGADLAIHTGPGDGWELVLTGAKILAGAKNGGA